MNCQLASTNVFLGGQMQWDLVVGSAQDELYIQEFHLSPISEYLNFQYNQDSDLLNYKHIENIKRFYGKLGKNFFKNSYNPKLDTLYPSFFNDSDYTYENSYHCGTKRISYNRYKKQFSALCPLWIEDWTGDISFDVNVFTPVKMKELNNDIIVKKSIIKKRLKITDIVERPLKSEETKEMMKNDMRLKFPYQDKFNKYLKEYLEFIKLDDNLCSIDYTTRDCWAKGINVEKGILETKDTSYVLNNLLERERPLLEFNSLITQQFASNKLIARQLFNFNIIFNIEDLLSPIVMDIFENSCASFYVEVTCSINDEQLEFKDFYTNHEYIDRVVLNSKYENTSGGNCLDYLQDYKCIDLIDKNKISPQICHWSLLDNNDYVFQLYDGFAPISYDDDIPVQLSHKYYNMPDIWSHNYTKHNNSIGWCNVIMNANNKFSLTESSIYLLLDTIIPDKLMTEFDLTQPEFYAQSIKYKNSNLQEYKFKCCILDIVSDGKNGFQISELLNGTKPDWNKLAGNNNILYRNFGNNKVFILVQNINKNINIDSLVYKEFIKLNLTNDDDLKVIQQSMLEPIYPKFIFFKKGLSIKTTNRPDTSGINHEIEYFKNDSDINTYLIRYDGKIRPCMIDIDSSLYYNYIYYKYPVQNNEDSVMKIFNKYISSGFKPLYPSLEYFSIKTGEFIVDDSTSKKINYTQPFIGYCNNNKNHNEYKWFNYSKIYNLKSTKQYVISSESLENITEDNLILNVKNKLKEEYKLSNNIETDFIYNLYDMHYQYEYKSKEIKDVNNLIYTITLKLK